MGKINDEKKFTPEFIDPVDNNDYVWEGLDSTVEYHTLGSIADVIADRVNERITEKVDAAYHAGIIVGAIVATIAIIAGYNF